MTDQDTLPHDHTLRILWPFLYRWGSLARACECLGTLGHPSAKKTWPCWQQHAAAEPGRTEETQGTGTPPSTNGPHALYLEDTLRSVRDFLFGGAAGGCGYLRVPDATADHWFGRGLVLSPAEGQTIPSDRARAQTSKVRLAEPGIEVFLSPHGVGVLSIALRPAEMQPLPILQDLNYRLSQARTYTAWEVQLLAATDPRAPAPPERQAPLVERLGRRGGAFQLIEWVEFLLQPLTGLDYERLQEQFSVFSVTRLGPAADFGDPAVTTALLPALRALAHVEEYGHAGSLHVTAQVLNTRHWAGVSSLACAHLVADQDPPLPYNDQRLPRALYKYFIPYLLGLLQRSAVQRLLREARCALTDGEDAPPNAGADPAEQLRRLNRRSLAVTVNGSFTEISSREVINQCFALTQTGLRLADSFGTIQRALRDAEAMDSASFQVDNGRFQAETLGELKTLAGRLEDLVSEAGRHAHLVAHVQSKVEWLEVFFVSYYFTALMYYVSHSGLFVHDYATWSLIAAPFVSGGIALLGLKPYKLDEETAPEEVRPAPGEKPSASKKKGHSWVFLVVLVLTFVAWLAIGLTFFPGCKDKHECKPVSAAEPTATASSH
jgi:hypothetical protein